jgi:hypothetical protein
VSLRAEGIAGPSPASAGLARCLRRSWCSSEPPRRFQARSVLDTGRSVARYFSGQMSRPGGAWPSSLRGGLPGISPHPRSPGCHWHDAPLRVFPLRRTDILRSLYPCQKYDITPSCCVVMTEGAATHRQNSPSSYLARIAVEPRASKAPRCWPTTPILPSKPLANSSLLVLTRADLSQTAIAHFRSDNIGRVATRSLKLRRYGG